MLAALSLIRVLPHIRRALDAGSPVVALESSVLAQGLLPPANADAARRMVGPIEKVGATAAITAVVGGKPTVGLEQKELEHFLGMLGIRKVAARDLGSPVADGADGATTVAAALVIASAARHQDVCDWRHRRRSPRAARCPAVIMGARRIGRSVLVVQQPPAALRWMPKRWIERSRRRWNVPKGKAFVAAK